MAAEYLEIAKTSERGTRTLIWMCHNFKNIVHLKESCDNKTELYTKNGFIIPVNYIEPILEYTKQRFNSTDKNTRKIVKTRRVRMPIDIMDVLLRFKQKKDVKKLTKRIERLFADYAHDCNEIWENPLGQLEVEHIKFLEFWSVSVTKWSNKNSGKSLPLLVDNFFW